MFHKQKKIIVALTGGLGNQLFQYAFGKAMQKKHNVVVEYDTNFYVLHPEWKVELAKYSNEKSDFKIHKVYGKMRLIFQRIPVIRWILGTYKERKEFVVDGNTFKYKYEFYAGYWQNYRYFEEIEELKNTLEYRDTFKSSVVGMAQVMSKQNSIAVHIRRGDYASEKFKGIFQLLDEGYFRRAISFACNILGTVYEVPTVYIFSNDILWCKQTFSDIDNVVFVDSSISDSQHSDMFLMRHAKCLIMSNSTFSWWAAWLNYRQNPVIIFPSKWFRDQVKNRDAVAALRKQQWILFE